MKKNIIILLLIVFSNCLGQSINKEFQTFLLKYSSFSFPANPTELLAERERKNEYKIINISKIDYNKYLREKGDSYWEFKEYFEYKYIGKKKYNNFWILIYYRGFLTDDVDKQRSEFILSTFTLDGKMISSLPIAGGYGDSITFSSKINDISNISVNYREYKGDAERSYTKYYYIDDGFSIRNKQK